MPLFLWKAEIKIEFYFLSHAMQLFSSFNITYYLKPMLEKVSFNKTKIVATVGPASNSKEMLRALIKEGVDVFRFNFSHGTHEDHLKVIQIVRELNKELGTRYACFRIFRDQRSA